MKRTHLPLNALRVFDAAARHLSFTRAADELAVTPAAVGQQIRALEDVLGVVLFRRTSKGLEMTDEASAGLDALRDGFLKFEESVQAMQAGQASSKYSIAVPREFYAQWLAPRLAVFRNNNPDITVLLTSDENADFTESNLDLAIRLVDGAGDLEGVRLIAGCKVCVKAPGAPDDWISWPTYEAPQGERVVLTVGNAGQVLSSALAGIGRAFLPMPLVEESLQSGKLELIGDPEDCRQGYWLLAPRPQWRQKKVKALAEFLVGN